MKKILQKNSCFNVKTILFFLICSFYTSTIIAQKVYTKNGNISFFSKSAMENISAENKEVLSVLNKQTGEYQFSLLVKGFHFKKALMEEHFNENYMESDKYHKASFKGTIDDIKKIDFTKDGNYKVEVTGDMTIHGITNKITAPGTITIKSGLLSADALFKLKLKDYKIAIPKIVKENIAEVIDITVKCNYNKSL